MNNRLRCAVALAVILMSGCGGDNSSPSAGASGPSTRVASVVMQGQAAAVATLPPVAFSGKLGEYSVVRNAGNVVVTERAGAKASVTVSGTTTLLFADATVATDLNGVAPKAYRLYQAAFNRTPDAGGLGFQISAMEGLNLPLEQIARGFVDSPEFAARYGQLDNTQFVTQIYRNVLHREPEPAGLKFYLDFLNAGTRTRAEVLGYFSESPENVGLVAGAIANGVAYTPYVVAGAGTATTLTEAKVAWNFPGKLNVVLRDERGTAVPGGALSCQPLNAATLEVSTDCKTARGLRLGEQEIKVSGGGVSAVLRVKVTPQRQLIGSYAPTGSSSGGVSLLVNASGNVLAWGDDSHSHVGLNQGSSADALLPVLVPGADGQTPLSGMSSVFGGEQRALGVTENGNVMIWGDYPELARSVRTFRPSLVRNAANDGALGGIVQVAGGWTNAAALTDDGRVYTWGYYHGQGDDKFKAYPNLAKDPTGTAPLSGIVAITSGEHHTLALGANGKVYGWGWNSSGQTGRGFRSDPTILPAVVLKDDGSELTDVVAITAGRDFSFALRADGTLYAWGSNSYSMLGQGKQYGEYFRAVPVKSSDGSGILTGVVAVAAGNLHALALLSNGQVLSWGFGADGVLGEGPNGDRKSPGLPGPVVHPDAIGNLGGIAAIGAAMANSYAIRQDGSVLMWGNGFSSGLGQGVVSNADSRIPLQVKNQAGTGPLVMPLGSYHNLLQRGRF